MCESTKTVVYGTAKKLIGNKCHYHLRPKREVKRSRVVDEETYFNIFRTKLTILIMKNGDRVEIDDAYFSQEDLLAASL